MKLKAKDHTQGIHPDDRPTAYEQSVPDDGAHGVVGHIGYRCYQCAQLSGVMIQLADNSGEYWQNLQLLWQEECDVVQNTFDDAVATHFPNHQPYNCESCPVPGEMPVKPLPPAERAVRQNALD